jgi:carboxylate-amine ligase
MVISEVTPGVATRPTPRLEPLVTDAFRPGGQFSVGVEEELLLVDEADQLVDERRTRALILATAGQKQGIVSPELFGSEIEFATAVCRDGESAALALADFRHALARAGGRPVAVGLHPAAPFGEPGVTNSPRYAAIGDDLAGVLRTPTAALQVHVGMPDAASAVAAYRGLRAHLPVLRAVSAGSPFWFGRDSGLATARSAVIRAYPRSGLPPVVRSWDEYVDLTRRLVVAAEAPDLSHVWWGARIQPRLGTVEVRVMDPQPSLASAAALTALVQGLAIRAVEARTTDSAADLPGELLAENDFRVVRHGLETTIIDATGAMRPVREVAAALVADARDALRPLGLDGPLDGVERMLADEPEYVRHRRVHETGGMRALLADLVDRTSYGW